MKRAIEMLRIAADYAEKQPDETIHYDEADCDGYCVAEDCRIAAEELERAMESNRWIPTAEKMPEPGVPVIALVNPNEYGKKRRIRAMWAPAKTLELALDAEGGEYSEEDDKYYCEEGWYETNEYEEVHWNVSGTVTHWQPLPPYPEGDENDSY